MSELRGPGVPAVAYRVYNSQNDIDNGYIGPWREDYMITGLSISSSTTTYYDGTGARWVFTKSGSTWTSPAGVNASLTQNGDGTWTVSYNRTGEKVIFNASGWLTKRQDRNGVGITYGYSSGRVVSVTDAVGKSIGMDYLINNGAAHSLDEVGAAGRYTRFFYDSVGRMDRVNEEGAGRPFWTMTYDASDRLVTMGGDGRSIAFVYDSASRVTKVTQSRTGESSVVTSFAYTATGTTVTDPRGNTSSYEVDSKWQVTKTTDQLGRTQSQTWTANSDVQTTTDGFSTGGGQGNVTEATYDQLNNQTGITLPTGAATQALYAQGPGCTGAQSGNPYRAKCTIDPSGNTQSMTYDAAGNLTAKTDTTSGGTASTTSYTYETSAGTVCGGKAGQICSATDANNKKTTYTYSGGNLIKTTPPAPLGPTLYEYDAVGRVTKVTDGNAKATTYAYDAADRITLTTFHNGQTLTNVWTPSGLLTSEADSATGTAITYKYNLLGKQTERKVQGPTGSGYSNTVTNGYDKSGNLVSTGGLGATTYAYDVANQLTALRPTSGSCTTSGNPAANSGCVKFTYDNNGHETARIFPGGARQNTTRDTSGRPTRITATDAGGYTKADVGYSYTQGSSDRIMLQKRTSHLEQGIPVGAISSYSYDSLNRLTKAEEKNGATVNASWTYTYDKASNRTSQTRAGNTGATAGTITYTYNNANQIASTSADTTTWAYDGAGNQTRNGITGQTATYGDRLQVTASGATTYTTFGPGNDLQLKSVTGIATTTLYSSDLGLIGKDLQGANTSWTRSPDGKPIALTQVASSYYVTDHLGSVLGMFGNTGGWQGGYSYSPYGEQRSASNVGVIGSNNIRYAGGYEESANLYKLGARYYDATLGRFTQYDPAGQESNPYTYAAANPCNAKDPTGTSVVVALQECWAWPQVRLAIS